MENKEQLFGTKAIEYTDSKFNFLSVVKRIFTLQNVKFWLITYLVSLIIYQFFNFRVELLAAFNFVLFPFAVIFIGSIANHFILSIPRIYRLLYPTYKNLSTFQNKVVLVITNIIKFFIYVIVWNYAFIVGIVGLVVTSNNARELTK